MAISGHYAPDPMTLVLLFVFVLVNLASKGELARGGNVHSERINEPLSSILELQDLPPIKW